MDHSKIHVRSLSFSGFPAGPILALSKQPLHPSLIICFRLEVLATAISGWEMLAPLKWRLVKLLISCMAALWSWYLALRGTHVFTFIYTYKHTHTQSYHLGNDEGVDVTYFSPYFFLFIFWPCPSSTRRDLLYGWVCNRPSWTSEDSMSIVCHFPFSLHHAEILGFRWDGRMRRPLCCSKLCSSTFIFPLDLDGIKWIWCL